MILKKKNTLLFCCLILGLHLALGQHQTELEIEFSAIDSLEYLVYKSNYPSGIVMDTSISTIPDSSFALVVANKTQHFACQKDYNDCHYYLGFAPSLNSYVLSNCFSYGCTTFLLNKTSGQQQALFSPFDSGCNAPVLSPSKDKMLVFASSAFDHKAYLSLYKRAHPKDTFNFATFEGTLIKQWRILEAIWIDETSFALMAFDEYGGKTGNEPQNLKYLKGDLK